jgi:hypothetical protein
LSAESDPDEITLANNSCEGLDQQTFLMHLYTHCKTLNRVRRVHRDRTLRYHAASVVFCLDKTNLDFRNKAITI